MLFVLKHLPLRLYSGVGLHVNMTLAPFEAVFLIDGYQVIEEQRISTFGSVFGQHTNQQHVDDVGLVELQSLDDVPPAERQQSAPMALLESLGQRGDGDAHTDDIVIRHTLYCLDRAASLVLLKPL